MNSIQELRTSLHKLSRQHRSNDPIRFRVRTMFGLLDELESADSEERTAVVQTALGRTMRALVQIEADGNKFVYEHHKRL